MGKPSQITHDQYRVFMREHYTLHMQWALEDGDEERAKRYEEKLKTLCASKS
jgi:hypothetical protein